MTQLRDAAAALQRGDLAAAERGFAAVLAGAPDNTQALHLLGIVRAQQGRMAEAESLMARAVAADPRAADVRVNHGNVLNLLGRFDEALADHDRSLKLAPGRGEILRSRAGLLLSLKRHAEALAAWRSLRTADPAARYALGGMFAAALHLCDWDQMVQIGAQVEASLKGGG